MGQFGVLKKPSILQRSQLEGTHQHEMRNGGNRVAWSALPLSRFDRNVGAPFSKPWLRAAARPVVLRGSGQALSRSGGSTMPVLVEKITVEGGFLDGLDMALQPGLNTLIGPRGAGKTSVIELIRFGLGVPNVIEEESAASRQHALSILGGGRVTLTVRSNGDRLTFSRSADDDSASLSIAALPSLPLMLGQGEIERVGLNAAGRLRLVDDFLSSAKAARSNPSCR